MNGSADTAVDEAVAFFRAFGDATRLRLVRLLCRQRDPHALCVNALADRLGVSQSAVSQHLRVLKAIGLVKGERRGYRIHYSVNANRLDELWESARDSLEADGSPHTDECHHQCDNRRQSNVSCG